MCIVASLVRTFIFFRITLLNWRAKWQQTLGSMKQRWSRSKRLIRWHTLLCNITHHLPVGSWNDPGTLPWAKRRDDKIKRWWKVELSCTYYSLLVKPDQTLSYTTASCVEPTLVEDLVVWWVIMRLEGFSHLMDTSCFNIKIPPYMANVPLCLVIELVWVLPLLFVLLWTIEEFDRK